MCKCTTHIDTNTVPKGMRQEHCKSEADSVQERIKKKQHFSCPMDSELEETM